MTMEAGPAGEDRPTATDAAAAGAAGAGVPPVPGAPAPTLVEVEHLVKYYPIMGGFLRRHVGDVKAVDDVSFEVRRGEVFGLVGESGCGKSTLGRTLVQLQPPTGGAATLDGEPIFGKKGKRPQEAPSPDADHLPGPGRFAEPADADQRHHR